MTRGPLITGLPLLDILLCFQVMGLRATNVTRAAKATVVTRQRGGSPTQINRTTNEKTKA